MTQKNYSVKTSQGNFCTECSQMALMEDLKTSIIKWEKKELRNSLDLIKNSSRFPKMIIKVDSYIFLVENSINNKVVFVVVRFLFSFYICQIR